MGSKVVQFDGNKKILTVDDTGYKLTSCVLQINIHDLINGNPMIIARCTAGTSDIPP